MSGEASTFLNKFKENPDLSFYLIYTILYFFMVGLTNVVNGIVGNNYGWYDVDYYWHHVDDIFHGKWPYQDFDTAYPPFSFVTYIIPYIFTPGEWTFPYGFTTLTYLCSLLAIHGLLKFCDSRNIDHKYVYITFLLLIIGVNNFYIARNDTITTVFVVLCLVFYWKQKYLPAFIFLALGIMTKIYPVFLLPVLLIPFIANRDWKNLLKYGSVTAIICLIIELPFLINDPSTAFSYLTQHSGRGFEIESIVAIPLMIVSFVDPSLVYVGMDESWDLFGPWAEAVAPFIMPMTFGIILVFMLYFLVKMWKLRPETEKMLPLTLLACAIVLMLFMAFNKVYCAQYIMWVIMLYPMIVYSYKVFGLETKRFVPYMAFLAGATLLTVACMSGATTGITIEYLLADTLKGIATFVLLIHLLKGFNQCISKCEAE